jgi:ABC-type transport system involved in cytochrome bd biosynthesis fused ATPase/permease subunit
MDIPSLRRVAYGFLVVVILTSCIVVTATQYQRAEDSTQRAERAEHALTSAQDELIDTQDELDYTSGNLDTVSFEVTTVSQRLNTAKAQRDRLAAQNRACRFLIRVNDQLMLAMTSQQNATGHLMHSRKKRAVRSVQRAGAHVRAVQAIVKRSGHTTIDGLIRACSPSS